MGFDLMNPISQEMGRVEIGLEGEPEEPLESVVLTFFAPLGEGGRAIVTVSARDTVMSVETAAVDEILGGFEGLRKAVEPEAPAAAEEAESPKRAAQASKNTGRRLGS